MIKMIYKLKKLIKIFIKLNKYYKMIKFNKLTKLIKITHNFNQINNNKIKLNNLMIWINFSQILNLN